MLHRLRVMVRTLAATTLVLLTLAGPAAARPVRTDISGPEYAAEVGALLTRICGYPVAVVDAEGFIMDFERTPGENGRQWVEKAIYHTASVTVASAWGEVTLTRDIGPDVVYLDDGATLLSASGRSISGSGTIGHTTVDLDTGEVLQRSGNTVLEDPVAYVCAELAPPE